MTPRQIAKQILQNKLHQDNIDFVEYWESINEKIPPKKLEKVLEQLRKIEQRIWEKYLKNA